MTEKTMKRRDLLLSEIGKSKMDIDDKLDLENLVQQAAETTNGLETPAKIAGMSDVLFGIVQLLVTDKIEGNGQGGKLAGLYNVIIQTKWQITIVAGLLAGCLIFRPEVAELLKALLK